MHFDRRVLVGNGHNWHLIREIGHGQFGTVVEAVNELGARAAIKCLNSEYADDDIALHRLLRELAALCQFEHSAFPKLLDEGLTPERTPFYATELLEGETLDTRRMRQGGTLDLEFVLSAADNVLSGISYAHRSGWLHRDLSPANLFFTSNGEIRILDLGLCRALEKSGVLAAITGSGILGTPGFIAPEQARGDWLNVDGRADLWSLGAILFYVLSGSHVHPGSRDAQLRAAAKIPARSIRDVVSNLPADVVQWIDRALAFQASERWASAEEMRLALARIHVGTQPEPFSPLSNVVQSSSPADPRTLGQRECANEDEPSWLALKLVHSEDPSAVRWVSLDDRSVLTIGRDEGNVDWVIRDALVSRFHARVLRSGSGGALRIVDQASRNGVAVNGHRCNTARLAGGDVIRLGDSLIVVVEQRISADCSQLLTANTARCHHVLLCGEAGVGKEFLARRIHEQWGCRGAFVTVDCAALCHPLAVQNLFGIAPGGSAESKDSKPSLIKAARSGTLFLNEISDLPPPLQSLLAKAMQRNRVRLLGDAAHQDLDVRIFASSSTPLESATRAGAFRLDLYAALSPITVRVPPLRERRHEILELFDTLVGREKLKLRLSADAAEAVVLGDWHANLCGLRSFVSQLAWRKRCETELDLQALKRLQPDLVTELASKRNAPAHRSVRVATARAILHEESSLKTLLTKHAGNVANAAKELDVTRAQVHRWAKKFGITVSSLRRVNQGGSCPGRAHSRILTTLDQDADALR